MNNDLKINTIIDGFKTDKIIGFEKMVDIHGRQFEVKTFDVSEKIDTQRYDTSNLVYLKVAYYVQNNMNKLNKQELKELVSAIDNKVEHIKSETGGFLGFFRYLFYPADKANLLAQQDQLESLKKLIESVIVAKDAMVHEQPKMEQDILHDEGEIPVPPKQDQAAQPAFIPLPQAGVGGPPPPPPPGLAPKPGAFAPPPPAPPKLFEGEIPEPKFQRTGYEKLSKNELEEQIGEIKSFIAGMKNALIGPKQSLAKAGEIESKISEERQKLSDNLRNFEKLDGNLKALTQIEEIKYAEGGQLDFKDSGETAYLYYVTSKTTDKIPYFSDQQFDAINAKREADWQNMNNERMKSKLDPLPDSQRKGIFKPLPEALRKRNAVQTLYNIGIEARKGVEETRSAIAKLETELADVKKSENNKFGYNQFSEMVKQKETKLQMWETALRNREKVLSGELKPKVAAAPKPAEQVKVPDAAAKSNLLPGEGDFELLEQSMSAQIILRGADKDPGAFYSQLSEAA